MQPAEARALHRLIEPLHAIVYFAPEPNEAYAEAGLKGAWMGYFASRSAPMGRVPAEVVTAAFYSFHPSRVARAIPDAWSFATPEAVVAARFAGAGRMLQRVLGDDVDGPAVRRALPLAQRAVEAADVAGRPLFAGHLSLDPPTEPHLALWHALTCLREHRGDGHIATLVAEGVDGCAANVLQAGVGRFAPEFQQQARGWSADEWAAAAAALAARGLCDADGALSDEGRALLSHVEDRTDALAAAAYRDLDVGDRAGLEEALGVLAARLR